MLSRTADNLFWLARYIERADLSRPHRRGDATARRAAARLWRRGERMGKRARPPPARGGLSRACETRDREPTSSNYLLSPRNPSSIRNCIEYARTNARAVRTALTVEMWDTINSAGSNCEIDRYRIEAGLNRPRGTSDALPRPS
jgi:uncharacterized alpha-E superfamily protein